jgi:hypothetical protein
MSRRWAAFAAAVAASAVLAVGFGLWVSHLAAATPAAPQLRTVPARTLPNAGISVAAASQPPYCDLERTAAERGWTSAGVAGCAITRPEAQAALLPIFQGNVTEAVLARVTGPVGSEVGQDRLVWLMVVRSNLLVLPATACGPPRASGPACAAGRMGPVSTQAIVIVDGTSGNVITTVPVPGQPAGTPSGS